MAQPEEKNRIGDEVENMCLVIDIKNEKYISIFVLE